MASASGLFKFALNLTLSAGSRQACTHAAPNLHADGEAQCLSSPPGIHGLPLLIPLVTLDHGHILFLVLMWNLLHLQSLKFQSAWLQVSSCSSNSTAFLIPLTLIPMHTAHGRSRAWYSPSLPASSLPHLPSSSPLLAPNSPC